MPASSESLTIQIPVDPAVWRPTIPLIVLLRCPDAQHLAVWIALRILHAAFPQRTGFSSREIARLAGVTPRYVVSTRKNGRPSWLEALVQLHLIVPAGTQPVHGACHPVPCYTLPLHDLERASVEIAPEWLATQPYEPPPQRECHPDPTAAVSVTQDMDPAVWNPTMPLAVLLESTSVQQCAVWLALRVLHAAFPTQRGFGSRSIAKLAGVNQKYITGKRITGTEEHPSWCTALVTQGALNLVHLRPIPGGHAVPCYELPLRELERRSLAQLPTFFRSRHAQPPRQYVPPEQLTLPLDLSPSDPLGDQITASDPLGDRISDPLGDQITASDPLGDRTSDPLGDQITASDPLGDQITASDPLGDRTSDPLGDQITASDPLGDQVSDPLRDHVVEEEGDACMHARVMKTIPHPPSATEFHAHPQWHRSGNLTKHPFDLWKAVSTNYQPIHEDHLTAWASVHDAATNGYGWYWVGQAILVASETVEGGIYAISRVKTILARWKHEDSYGSSYTKTTVKELRTNDTTTRPSRSRPTSSKTSPSHRSAAHVQHRTDSRSKGRHLDSADDPRLRLVNRSAPLHHGHEHPTVSSGVRSDSDCRPHS